MAREWQTPHATCIEAHGAPGVASARISIVLPAPWYCSRLKGETIVTVVIGGAVADASWRSPKPAQAELTLVQLLVRTCPSSSTSDLQVSVLL